MELHPFLLIFELRRAVDVLERELMSRLAAAGWSSLTINQVLVFAFLEPEGVTQAELARRMGMSRQSMQKHLERLRELKLVTTQPHPRDGRASLVMATTAGRRLSEDAARLLDGFERRMEATMGTQVVNDARAVLTSDLDGILATGQNASGR
jgi:DNA-binding MarR family transcriptional regulator